nr:malto-oligosyltrehalose synthase [Demequina rhizosphaerae]
MTTDVTPERSRSTKRQGHRAGAQVPVSTYRLQLSEDFTFADAADRLDYFASLGVSHLYLSPILTAAPGSTHFYDVVDHSRIAEVLGGEQGLRNLSWQAGERGIGLVADVVPNHMAVPTPAFHNKALWSVLEHGLESPFAHWFDVDWESGEPVLMPVLGQRIGTVLSAGELSVDHMVVPGHEDRGEVPVLRYWDHVFPIRAGTEHLPLASLVEEQHYRLAYWRVANEELNYRRFFDVGSLVAVRVEDEDVFDATHERIVALVNDGTLDGLRIDHPDGLADPEGYLARLSEATNGAWIVVEKILEDEERLPTTWRCAGTTGYDASWRVGALLRDPAGAAPLAGTLHRVAGDAMGELPDMIDAAKWEIVRESLSSEVHRLATIAHHVCTTDVRLRDHTWRALYDCLRTLLVTFDRYRAYVVPGEKARPASAEVIDHAAERARRVLDPERHETLDVVVDLLKGAEVGSAGRTVDAKRSELITRFQQACGAVMAKGVEDTAYYRWTHLLPLCEVGSPAGRFAMPPAAFHAWAHEQQQLFPHAMTCLSTHDTKRSEDVRARLGVLSEAADQWDELVQHLRTITEELRPAELDGRTENLWWQTLVGTSDEDGLMAWDRLEGYLIKAMREAKSHTTWTSVDETYESQVLWFAQTTHADPAVREAVEGWNRLTATGVRAAILGQKLLQLTVPGVPDVYQGTELLAPSLVDPDNRRPVDFDLRQETLRRLTRRAKPRGLAEEKMLVTSAALRLRRDHAEAFIGADSGYVPLASSSGHAVVFARTVAEEPTVITVATRAGLELERLGGWSEHTVQLPEGHWRDVIGRQVVEGGPAPLAQLLRNHPVALLERV